MPSPSQSRMLTIRMSPDLHAAIKEAAWRQRKSMNQFAADVLGVVARRIVDACRPDAAGSSRKVRLAVENPAVAGAEWSDHKQ